MAHRVQSREGGIGGMGIKDIKQYDSLVSMLHDRETLLIRKVKSDLLLERGQE